jgi:hypothetical protein
MWRSSHHFGPAWKLGGLSSLCAHYSPTMSHALYLRVKDLPQTHEKLTGDLNNPTTDTLFYYSYCFNFSH